MNEIKILIALCLGITVVCASGCFSLVTGIKSYKGSDGSEIQFVTGFDIGATANGTDTVNNTRGINPGGKNGK